MRKEAKALVEKDVVLRESEIALSMLADGVNIETISKYTGLSEEEIGALDREE